MARKRLRHVALTDAKITTVTIDGTAITNPSGISGVTASSAEINQLVGATFTAADLNKLAAVTSSAAELNLIDTSVAGTAVASKAAVLGANKELDEFHTAALYLGAAAGTAVTATATEINKLAGVTAGTLAASKAIVVGALGQVSELHTAALYLGINAGTLVTSSAAELNILTGVTATATEINKLASVTAGTASASKAAVLGASKELDVINGIQTVATADLGTVRTVHGQITASNANISAGVIAGARGLCTLSGTINSGGAYLYGAQGKLAVTGTMNHADARLAGLVAQLDISAGTYTTGQLSCLWVDAGATAGASAVATKGGGQFNLVRITNTTAANANAVLYAYAEADYLLDLGGPAGNADWFDAGTGATASCTGHLKVKLNGADAFIRVYQSTS